MKKKIIYCIPFIIVWCFIIAAISVAYNAGVLSVIKDAFGNSGAAAISLLGLIAILSMIYLRFFVKKEWKIQLTAYLLTILFCSAALISINAGDLKFIEFSSELWAQYPARRITMVADLKARYNLNGYNEKEIADLLGQPDSITDGIYVYNATHGNAVYVEFKNDKVNDVYYIE